ncbi:DJ-1 family glyoxalase III [Candidatus Soleaferrea massiliensis]|uniref:DJ-1 family glyoxalase III n=1 Tax=Candidatus Soleaferrea massiliensis TaxID=1470354 RepID=UPI00058D058B|nr:DJ-1 family glyoxalase III [Candidatus Soleaferrea massiliensis]
MIYVFMANGTEEIEALACVDVLRRAELDVQIVGVGGKVITGSHGITVAADIGEDEISTDGLQMIVLPGGMPGTLHLEQSRAVQQLLGYCAEREILIAAICAAPSILGHRGLLKGRKAVCFPGFEEQLLGAKLVKEPVCQDGTFITAKGMGVAVDFALKLVEVLCSPAKSEKIRASLQCAR